MQQQLDQRMKGKAFTTTTTKYIVLAGRFASLYLYGAGWDTIAKEQTTQSFPFDLISLQVQVSSTLAYFGSLPEFKIWVSRRWRGECQFFSSPEAFP